MNNPANPLSRAVAALNSFLARSSAIALKEIGVGWPVDSQGAGCEIDILAHVEIFGRRHILACQVSNESGPEQVGAALKLLRGQIAFLPGKVTAVLIVPVLSHETRALCEADNVACLDLQGNGRLGIDEIFVSTRSLPRRALHQGAYCTIAPPRHTADAQMAHADADENVLRGFPPARVTPPNRAASGGQRRAH